MLVEPLELEAPQTPRAPFHVLIVDDEPDISEPLRMRLDRLGFRVSVAPRGDLALKLARSEPLDCILLDLCLPDVDGLELCQQLVDDEMTCDTPVIIVSGAERKNIIRHCRAAGCHYYVRKPYDPNALLTLIRQAIGESRDEI
jgi:DNA-binding response OmpR family regulator